MDVVVADKEYMRQDADIKKPQALCLGLSFGGLCSRYAA